MKRLQMSQVYPTQSAWKAADEAVDRLPETASMQEHLRVWEESYFAAGGKPGQVKT